MKYKLSILIPGRNEQFMGVTIQDVLCHTSKETEVIAVLDGYEQWHLPKDSRVTIIRLPKSIGQRAAINLACKLSEAKYVLKLDAHCSLDDNFDKKMFYAFEKVGDNITVVPIMRNLWAFDWVCSNGHRRYQGISGPCKECKKPTHKEMKWISKSNPQSTSYCFDTVPHFQYFKEYTNRPEYKKGLEIGLTETMSLQGSCFMLTRDKYWELNMNDETWGSWGSQGAEIATRTWLSGGRVLVNHKTFYSHLFRTQGGDFGFPYPMSGRIQENTRKCFQDLFYKNKWDKQIYPLSWLVEKFWPVPGWNQKELDSLKTFDSFISQSSLSGDTNTNITTPKVVPVSNRKYVSPLTMGLPRVISPPTSQNIISGGDQQQMVGITTTRITTNKVVDNKIGRQGTNEPGIHETMKQKRGFTNTPKVDPSITMFISKPPPNPTSRNGVNINIGKNEPNYPSGNFINGKFSNVNHDTYIIPQKEIIYYTDCQLDSKIMKFCQEQLIKAANGIPIISISLKPINFGDKKIVLPLKRSLLTMSIQILTGLEASNAEIIYFTEHDLAYHPSHFDFTPPKKDVYYYNTNSWMLRLQDGHCLFYEHKSLSGICAYRETLLNHYRERVRRIEELLKEANGGQIVKATSGNDIPLREAIHRLGFEPGTHNRPEKIDNLQSESWKSEHPNVDIKHDKNWTKNRWKVEQFRDKSVAKSWKEAEDYKIDGWDTNLLKGIL